VLRLRLRLKLRLRLRLRLRDWSDGVMEKPGTECSECTDLTGYLKLSLKEKHLWSRHQSLLTNKFPLSENLSRDFGRVRGSLF
jgi:hypothetical protein